MASADVLLTYAWCRTSYVALRSLAGLGLRVAVADTGRSGMCQGSRLKTGFFRYTQPLDQPEEFVADVCLALQQTGALFLLPGHDETEVLARYRDRLPARVILPVASAGQLALANNKDSTFALASFLGLPVPLRVEYESLEELAQKLAEQSGTWVVKLRRSNSAKGVFYPSSSADALEMCTRLCNQYQLATDRLPIVQQRVEGEGWGVSCLYWQGQRLASFTHRRLREKTATGGTSTLRVSARNPLLEDIAHRMLDELRWHGLAMVEFKYDPSTRQGWFIEINPRLWGSIHLAVASGVDFPALLYIAATQGPDEVGRRLRPWREGVVARWYLGDWITAAGALRRGKLLSALKMILPGGADTYDDVHFDDPGAFIGQAAYYLAGFLRSRSLNPELKGMVG